MDLLYIFLGLAAGIAFIYVNRFLTRSSNYKFDLLIDQPGKPQIIEQKNKRILGVIKIVRKVMEILGECGLFLLVLIYIIPIGYFIFSIGRAIYMHDVSQVFPNVVYLIVLTAIYYFSDGIGFYMNIKKDRPPELLGHRHYNAEFIIPRKIYADNSENIKIKILPATNEAIVTEKETAMLKSGKNEDLYVIDSEIFDDFDCKLEVELMTAGISVGGDKKQVRILGNDASEYCWNCYFNNSGRHRINFNFCLIYRHKTVEIANIEKQIDVLKILFLNQRQVWVLSIIGAIVSFVLTVFEILHLTQLI